MLKYKDLLKQKSAEYKQNHVSQMKELKERNQKLTALLQQQQSLVDDHSHASLRSIHDGDDESMTFSPKKPSHEKKKQLKQDNHRSLISKEENGNFEDENQPSPPIGNGGKENLNFEEEEINLHSYLITKDKSFSSKEINADEEFNSSSVQSSVELDNVSSFVQVIESKNLPPSSPGQNLPAEEVASLFDSDWIVRMTSTEFK
jgi:NADH pyrophosphatase NudC (nudix superfamily)